MLKWEEYTAAAKELSPSALNLFMYLAKNQDKYEMWFSSKDYCDTFNLSDKTFRNAKKELLNKGYLKEGENNHMYFDSSGAYKESIETLSEQLIELSERIRVLNENRYNDFFEELKKINPKNIENEYIKKSEIKKLISFGEDILKDITQSEFKGFL